MPPPVPFVADILAQPASLRAVPVREILDAVEPLRGRLTGFERIVLTGMGASLAALRPLWLELLAAGRPAWWLDTAELLAEGAALLGPTTLVLAASQSGQSAEIVSLVREREHRRFELVGITNDPDGPLARAASRVVPIAAGVEHAVSTRTYVNTLAACFVLGSALAGRDPGDQVARAAEALDTYLAAWRGRITAIGDAVGLPERLCLLGRGASLAAAQCGSLILKEAAKFPAEAQSAAQFRHGPLELADARLTVLILAGEDRLGRERNATLGRDLTAAGARIAWVDDRLGGAPSVPMPQAVPGLRGVAEILPLQLLCVSIAERTGIEPGRFRHIAKVTTVE